MEDEAYEPEARTELARICEEQKKRIEVLERQLREKDKELQTLRKQPSPAKPNPFFEPFSAPQAVFPAHVSGSEFWDNHLENSEGNDYSFEDIAAKGLWILTSGTDRKSVLTQAPRKLIESQRTMPMASTRKDQFVSPLYSPKQNFANPVKPQPQSEPLQLPKLREEGRSRKPYASASPLKPRNLQQPTERNQVKEPVYPASQGYLRKSFKREDKVDAVILSSQRQGKGGTVSPAKRVYREAEATLKPAKGVSSSPIRQRREAEGRYLKPVRTQPVVKSTEEYGYSKQARRVKK